MRNRHAMCRRLASLTTAAVLIVGLLTPAGCRRPTPLITPPVTATNWRTHLSAPTGLTRHWVLPDNTMLAEIAVPAPDGGPPWRTAYEIYDPGKDRTTRIVAPDAGACLRSIGDGTVQFQAGMFTAVPWLVDYDLTTQSVTERPVWYRADSVRRFGQTNIHGTFMGASASVNGVTISIDVALDQQLIVRPDAKAGTLLVELPGIESGQTTAGRIGVPTLPSPIRAIDLRLGVKRPGGITLPGVTLCLTLAPLDWAKLTYSWSMTHQYTNSFTLSLSLSEPATNIKQTVALPTGWDDWRDWALFAGTAPVESWPLADGRLLVRWDSWGNDQTFGLCDPDAKLVTMLVSSIERPSLKRITPERIELLGDMGGISAYVDWPYVIVIDITDAIVSREDTHLSVEQPVRFSGGGLLKSVTAAGGGVELLFRPGPPIPVDNDCAETTTRAIASARQLLIQFHNSPFWPDYDAAEGLTLGPLAITGAPFIVAAALQSGIVTADGKAEPGVTLRLTLDAEKWAQLTYSIQGIKLPEDRSGVAGGFRLLISDQEPITDISAIADRMR